VMKKLVGLGVQKVSKCVLKQNVAPTGIEPATLGLLDPRSNQLSYGADDLLVATPRPCRNHGPYTQNFQHNLSPPHSLPTTPSSLLSVYHLSYLISNQQHIIHHLSLCLLYTIHIHTHKSFYTFTCSGNLPNLLFVLYTSCHFCTHC
jgi:hypothetical protein